MSVSVSELVAGKRVALLVNRSALAGSCAANYVSAATYEPDVSGGLSPTVRGLIAMLWPLALMGGELLLTRVPAVGSRRLLWSCRLAALVVAVFAFVGSAEHLVSLALRAGASELAAWSAPIIVDGLLLISGLVLVGLADAIGKAKREEAEALKQAEEEAVAVRAAAELAAATPVVGVRSRGSAAGRSRASAASARGGGGVSSEEVAAALAVDGLVTAGVLAERFGVSVKTIRRSEAWQQRNRQSNGSGVLS